MVNNSMAIMAIEQQAFFIKNLKSVVNKNENGILLDYDQSETEDLILINKKAIIAYSYKKNSLKKERSCYDFSETDTVILKQF